MDELKIENQIRRFEAEPSAESFRKLIEGLSDMDNLPILSSIKLMQTIGKVYGYGNFRMHGC